MRLNAWVVTVWGMGLVLGGVILGKGTLSAQGQQARGNQSASGQVSTVKNPRDGDPDAIRAGNADYHARCASCHGPDAKGTDRGSDLTGIWAAGGNDQLFGQIVRRGVPDTLMPHGFGTDRDVWAILAYLKTLNGEPSNQQPPGDGAKGEQIFSAKCSICHEVNNNGGHLGPDLSRIGASRLRPLLAQKIRHSSSYIMNAYSGGFVTDGYEPVTLVTNDGQRIRGVKKNEDAFSIQIMDTQQRLQGYPKASLREVINDTKSLMPDFGPGVLSDGDLDDLLAYLGTLRGANLGVLEEK